MNINSRIKKIRIELKLSQTEFAKALGVTQPSLSDIEKGKTTNIDERNIKLICKEFNVNEEWLRTGEGEMFSYAADDIISELEKKYEMGAIFKSALSVYLKANPLTRKVIDDCLYEVFESAKRNIE